LGKKARELKKAAEALHQEERSGNKGRKWRKNVKALEKVHIFIKIALSRHWKCLAITSTKTTTTIFSLLHVVL